MKKIEAIIRKTKFEKERACPKGRVLSIHKLLTGFCFGFSGSAIDRSIMVMSLFGKGISMPFLSNAALMLSVI